MFKFRIKSKEWLYSGKSKNIKRKCKRLSKKQLRREINKFIKEVLYEDLWIM